MSKRKTPAPHQAIDALSPASNLGHEYRDVSAPWTLFSAATVAALVIGCCIVSRFVFAGLLEPPELRSNTSATGEGLTLPPTPRLEGIEMMSALQIADQSSLPDQQLEEDRLRSYGWVNHDQRTVRIPINRAMQIIVQ